MSAWDRLDIRFPPRYSGFMKIRSAMCWLTCAFTTTLALTACESVDIDPSVAERPLPRAGDPVDAELAAAGETVFLRSCVACHDWEKPLVGPALAGVTERRSPEWIRSMVLSPDSMLVTDSVVRTLHGDYPVPMPDLQIGEVRFRAIWEYMRSR